MAEPTKRKKWSDVKARLEAFHRKSLVSLLGELYDASVANRRFLHSRLTPGSGAIEEYRHLVTDAIYPDPRVEHRPGDVWKLCVVGVQRVGVGKQLGQAAGGGQCPLAPISRPRSPYFAL